MKVSLESNPETSLSNMINQVDAETSSNKMQPSIVQRQVSCEVVHCEIEDQCSFIVISDVKC